MHDWVHRVLPERWQRLLSPEVMVGILIFSAVAVAATLVLIPWFFSRIPADYCKGSHRPSLPFLRVESRWRLPLKILKNLAGALLLVLGLLMLVLPGQGILTLVFGLFLLDFPGKRRFECWLISRGPVLKAVNAIRKRAKRPELEL